MREFQKNIYFCFKDYAKGFDHVDHNKLWQILKEMEYQTTWPAFWEICVQVRKQQLELDREQHTGSKSRKEYIKTAYCHPAYLTYTQSTSWEILGRINKAQAGIKIAWRNNLRYADDTILMAESEEDLKILLMKVKEESGKIWLKTQHSEN